MARPYQDKSRMPLGGERLLETAAEGNAADLDKVVDDAVPAVRDAAQIKGERRCCKREWTLSC